MGSTLFSKVEEMFPVFFLGASLFYCWHEST